MVALTQDRNTPRSAGDIRSGGVAAGQTIYAGAIAMRNAGGFLVKGAAATGLIGVGRAEARAVNAGSNGDVSLDYRPGVYRFENSGGGDAITAADIGALCFAVDDQTVAKTDDGGDRSPAGFIDDVDPLGVWVRFDEAAVRSHAVLAAAIAAID